MDLYLKFDDEAQATSLLYASGQALYMNIDTIGIIYEEQPPLPDSDGPQAPVPLPGWHVNVRLVDGEDDTPLMPFTVHPVHPRRVWSDYMIPPMPTHDSSLAIEGTA